jgi:hypothetical protein
MRDDGGQKTSFVCSARELIAQAQSKSSDSLSPADVEGDGAKLDETRLNSQPLAASSAAHAPFPV